ncbi:MAG: hypothetical protein LBL63_02035 [Clostridiales Family XIII bacterium]|jgi:hypothetical protein|nr:hypothetical protein [Clostridiales Family XIII bacterium]
MELNELLKLLDIDSPQDLIYFEQYAELVENEEEISLDTLARLFEEADKDVVAELTEGYFEDILRYIPEDASEFYALLSSIGQNLLGLASMLDAEGNRQIYTEEFHKFRNWYGFDSEVTCTKLSDDVETILPAAQALSLYRAEHLNDDEYSYDFSGVLDYPLDEYIVPISGLDDDDDEEPFDDRDE